MVINVEFSDENEMITLSFLKKDSLIKTEFVNITLLIDALCAGHFCYHPYDGYKNDLYSFIKNISEDINVLSVRLDLEGLTFGYKA